MSAGFSEVLREAEYRNPGHMLYGHAAETVDELCEALTGMVEAYLCEADPYSHGGFHRNLNEDECVADALAALAKARGEQSK